ncbi:MAG TPA: hypothetical protein VLD38_07140 [Nitrosopumilaceae archaeon]|nr:hypothetical protein [Nitrosopumilaceae archaeon]
MIDLDQIEQIFVILNTLGTIILIVLFWKTIKHLEEASKNARIQTNYRFRPWVGPTNGIKLMSTTDNRHQFGIDIKNYGEIPASNIIAMFKMKNDMMTRDLLKNPESLESFNLGPLLPNMEKRYWFFIDSDLVEKAKNGGTNIFTLLYFSYDHLGGKSGYGMISQYDPKTDLFLHKDMWVD